MNWKKEYSIVAGVLVGAVLVMVIGMWLFGSSGSIGMNITDNFQQNNKTARDMNTYTNTEYGFSFQYPKRMTISEFAEGQLGDVVLVQEKDSAKTGLQLFITPFDEEGPVTPKRIKKDVPDMVIEDPRLIELPAGPPALAFFSENESLGRTIEVWFVHHGYLYQVSSYADALGFVTAMLETLEF